MIELLNTTLPNAIDQKMIWVADYNDGTHLIERNLQDNSKNSFYNIEKHKLNKFGIIGMDYNCYFNIFGGVFTINGRKINIKLITDNHIHNITEQNMLYDDIITFKDASAKCYLSASIDEKMKADPNFVQKTVSEIDAFNIGYKCKIISYGVEFYVQTVVKFPCQETPSMNIKFSANKNLEGKMIISVDNSLALEKPFSVEANYGDDINWKLAL